MKALKGKIALVTGVGRHQGIGAALCQALADNGADVFFTYWHPYDGSLFPENNQIDAGLFAAELTTKGVRAAYAEVDLSQLGAAEQLFATATSKLGTPNILINNACADYNIPFTELTEAELNQHYAVNVRATAMLCRELVKSSVSGQIINMTSGQDLGPMGSDKIPYAITKASVEMLTLQLAPELEKQDITINAVDPGPTDTGWMTDELKSQLAKESKRGRVSVPADTADLIIKLLIENAKTGQIIHAER